MSLVERLEEIKKLWYELELPLRQDVAYVYLDKEQKIIKNIDQRLELLLENRDFQKFLKRLRKDHKLKEISEIEEVFSKKYKNENAQFWHEEAQEAVVRLFRDILPDIKIFEAYNKTRHEMLRFRNEIPAKLQQIPKAGASKKVGIAIIGAGFSGLAAAYFLLKSGVPGKDITIFEKEKVGSGSSGRSGGFLTASVEIDFIDAVKDMGKPLALKTWRAAEYGIDLMKEVSDSIGDNGRYFRYNLGYLYLTEDDEYLRVLRNEARALSSIGNTAKIIPGSELKARFNLNGYKGALYSHKASFVYSVGFINEMSRFLVSKGVRILENTQVEKIDRESTRLIFGDGRSLECGSIIIASNHHAVKFGISKSMIGDACETCLALTEPLPIDFLKKHKMLIRHIMWDSKEIYSYFTILDDGRIMIGGQDKNFPHAAKLRTEINFIHYFYEYLTKHFQELRGIRFQKMWSGVIVTPPDTSPLAGRLGNTNVYISVNNGIPYCFLSGKILADIMTGKPSEYAGLFDPNREMIASTAQIFGALSKK